MLAVLTVLAVLAGCSVGPGPVPAPVHREARDPQVIRIASFDFPENIVLAELYGQQLRTAGLPVEVLGGLGTREVVQPALRQGMVDIVIDYTGTLLDFLGGSTAQTHGPDTAVYAALQDKLAPRGMTALQFAAAEDANAFAVTTTLAEQHHLRRLSDLRPLAARFTLGGPPECPTRHYCAKGLAERYRLGFHAFRSEPTRAATATALETGEIDVGMLETTDGRLASGRLVLLEDDLHLQPRENVVPVVRTELLRRYGELLARPLDQVSARLTTLSLIRLNRTMLLDPSPADQVAAGYLPVLLR